MTPYDDVLRALEHTSASLDAMAAQVARNRFWQRVAVFVGVLAIVVVGFTLAAVSSTANRAERIAERLDKTDAAAVAACMASAEQNRNQHVLWEGILALPTNEPPDPDTLEQFFAILDETFPELECG